MRQPTHIPPLPTWNDSVFAQIYQLNRRCLFELVAVRRRSESRSLYRIGSGQDHKTSPGPQNRANLSRDARRVNILVTHAAKIRITCQIHAIDLATHTNYAE
jgi:hypothetical protein